MTLYRERQWNAERMLLCTGENGDVQHAAPMPRVRTDGGVTSSDLRCEWCYSPMLLVDVLTIERSPTLLTLDGDRGSSLYTTAKLHPFAMLAAAGAASSQSETA